MSFQVKCMNCNHLILIEDANDVPKECEQCQDDLNAYELTELNVVGEDAHQEVCGLVWQQQKNSNSFKVSKMNEGPQFIGRNHIGSEILSRIMHNNMPVISRKHCSVEFIENTVFIYDEASTNGTFRSVDKISCSSKQQIKDNELIWLGNEPFIVSFEFSLKESEPLIQTERIERYYCKNCGFEDAVKHQYCLKCKEYGRMTLVNQK